MTNRGESVSTQQSSATNDNGFAERQKAKWKPDQLATNCERCGQAFGLLRRKHHCRRCHNIFCDACSTGRVMLPGYGFEPQRVCKICEAIISASDESSGNNSNANRLHSASSTGLGGNNNADGGKGGLNGFMSRLSGLGGMNNTTSSSSPPVKNPKNQQQQQQQSQQQPIGKFPSLEMFPRERRVLLIGSPGVGKGSFIATACIGESPTGNNNNNNNNGSNTNNTSSPQYGNNAGRFPAAYNDDSYGGFNNNNNYQQQGNNNNNSNTANLSEKKRTIRFMGHVYELVLVNTAGSTVSSELFVHPLLTIGTSAYILMYDVTEPKSFEVLPLLHERLLDCGAHDRAIILVGSKADHVSASGAGRERVVSKDVAIRLANQWKAPHVDVSCTSKESVDNALMELLKEIAARDTY